MNTPGKYILKALFPLLLLSSCSVEKNTSLSRNYHNLTAHYNIYFNANESYIKAQEKIRSSVQNDFSRILPVMYFQDEKTHSAGRSDLKRTIDKATKVITVHSITAKPKVKKGDQSQKDKAFFEKNEYNKWVDDSYMLMGKSYMQQGEYFLAVETFKHVISTFPAEDIRFLGMTWLTRAYIMIEENQEAERLLVSLEGENKFPEEYLLELYLSRTMLEISNENYGPASDALALALEEKGINKLDRVRYTYILAQLYENSDRNQEALNTYKKVVRMNPPYELAFNARVSMAEVFESGSAGSDELKKLLKKMLRDSKNQEYLDQIYFALGNIAMEEGDKELAMEYYQLSVSSSVGNNYQKGFSSVTLAKIYYEEPDYILSAAYYDSAVSFLDDDFPGYLSLMNRSASLSNLVYNINTWETQDSVQKLALMPENERNRVIDDIIEQVRVAEEEARRNEQLAMQDMAFNQSMIYRNQSGGTGGMGNQGGLWYFYNLQAKSMGQPEFKMKFGDRPLEDDWRRKNKQNLSAMMQNGSEADSAGVDGGTPVFDNKSREFYLMDIPLSDSAMEQSHLKLEEALFNTGQIYKDQLLDYGKAIEAFEGLVRRYPYPEGRFNADALYYLYNIYNSQREQGLAGARRQTLVSRYPESHFTKLLNNPNYIQELEEEEMKVVRAYERVFEFYQNGNHASVISGADSAVVTYPDDQLVPKFKYIRALSVGALTGKEDMKTELDSLISQHPESEESIQARELVEYMYETFPVIKEAADAQVGEEIYATYDSLQQHYLLLAVSGNEDVNMVSFNLLNYNLDNFNEYDMQIDKVPLTDGFGLIAVSPFNNAEGAQRYLEVIEGDLEEIIGRMPASNYKLMLISLDNFSILTEQKQHQPYYLFYRKHYLSEE